MNMFITQILQRFIGPQRIHFLSVVVMLVRRELKVKYRGSVLGYLWSMLNPLLFMLIISFVFSHFFKSIEFYNLYILSGILVWNMTTLTLNVGVNSVVANAALLKKVKIPHWVFPFVALGSALVNFLLALIPYTIIYLWSGKPLSSQIFLFPIVLALYSVFLCGVVMALSMLNVFFRDVGHVLEPILSILFYATPILYDRNNQNIPQKISTLLGLNPIARFFEAFRATLFGRGVLHILDFGILFLISVIVLAVGIFIYKQGKAKVIFNI